MTVSDVNMALLIEVYQKITMPQKELVVGCKILVVLGTVVSRLLGGCDNVGRRTKTAVQNF